MNSPIRKIQEDIIREKITESLVKLRVIYKTNRAKCTYRKVHGFNARAPKAPDIIETLTKEMLSLWDPE